MLSNKFILFILLGTISAIYVDCAKPLMCYLANYAVYRPDSAKFTSDLIDPYLCTHLIYAHLGISEGSPTVSSIDPYVDTTTTGGFGLMAKVTSLKTKNPSLKVLFSLGGWEAGSPKFSKLSESFETRKTFIASIVDTIKTNNFDGVDMNWMYPNHRGGKPEDVANYVLLLQELRRELKKHNYMLVGLLSGNEYVFKSAYNLASLAKELDYVMLLSYDYHGFWDGKTGVFAPLRYTDSLSITSTVDQYVRSGVPSEKMLLGFPTHGRTFIANEDFQGNYFGVPTNDSFTTPWFKEKGFIGYNEICREFKNNDLWTQHWHSYSSTPFAVSGRKLISYDDERSYMIKLNFLKENNLGGAMVWSLDTDDFRGDCYGKKFYLTKVIKSELGNADLAVIDLPTETSKESSEESKRPISVISVSVTSILHES